MQKQTNLANFPRESVFRKFFLVLAVLLLHIFSRRRRRRLRHLYNWINHSRSTFLQRLWRQRQINRVNKLDFNEILLIEKNAYIWKNKLYSAYDIQDVNILCLNIFSPPLYPPLKRGPYRLPGPCVLLTATRSKALTLVLQAHTQKKEILLQSKREEISTLLLQLFTLERPFSPTSINQSEFTVSAIHNF